MTGAWAYDDTELDDLGVHCSHTERRADDATRQVDEWLKCEFMQDHIGSSFTGVIAAVTNFGLFVRLDEYQIDGLVHISNLGDDYYQFDNTKNMLVGENSHRVFRLGDKVEVRVKQVNLDDRKIDLELLSAESPTGKSRMPKGNKGQRNAKRVTKIAVVSARISASRQVKKHRVKKIVAVIQVVRGTINHESESYSFWFARGSLSANTAPRSVNRVICFT